MTATFDVLAEPIRRRILDDVRDEERSVGDLVERLHMSQPGVSKHLRVLREAGLVEVRRDAQRRLYRVRPEPLAEVDAWLAPYRRLWAGASTRWSGASMTMPAERDGVVTVEGGRVVIRFERRLGHPVERVWDALTRPERIAEWFGEGEVHLELVPGGEYRTRTTGPPELVEAIVSVAGEEGLEQRNTVLAVEPPTLLEHTFGGDPASVVRWELRPDDDGCRLSLRHVMPSLEAALEGQVLPGWQQALDLLAASVAGRPEAWSLARFEALRDGYARD